MSLMPSTCAACGGSGTISDVNVTNTVCVSDCGIPLLVSVTNFPTSVEISNDVGNPIPTTAPDQHAEDSPHVSGDIGSFSLAVRNDAGTNMVSADGDYAPFQVDSTGALRVTSTATAFTGRDDTDNQAAVATGLQTVVNRLYAFDGTTWDRVRSGATAGSIIVDQGTSPWVVSGTVTADTELPAASALADADPNPTTSRIGANNLVFNGTTWDRVRSGTALGSVLVNNPTAANLLATVTQGTSPWVVSGTVTADTELPAASALADADPNPTTSRIGANNLVFNGTTWDRVRSGTALGSVLVNNPTVANLQATATIKDSAGPDFGLFFSTDNEMMVAVRTNVFRLESTGAYPSASWTSAHVGSGTSTHNASGELMVATGVTANSTAKITSVQSNRQMSGTTQMYICPVRLNNLGVANNIRRWGLYDDNNGFFFQLSGTTFSIVTRKAGVDTAVSSGSWNGVSTFNPATDLTNYNQFGLFFGGMSCRFHINGKVAHAFPANSITSPLTAVLSLPFRTESINSGGLATDQQVISRGTSFHRVSPHDVTPRYVHISTAGTAVCRSGPGTFRGLVFNDVASTGTVTMYDNTAGSGTVIGVINLGGGNSAAPFSLTYGMEVSIGLTIVTTTTNDITVIFD